MVRLPRDPSDDPAFTDLAERAVNGAAARSSAMLIHVVKIDSWFGDRWYSFSGKLLGVAGMRMAKLTIPPFHPNRVVSEVCYRNSGTPGPVAVETPLHAARTSQSNLRNFFEGMGDSVTAAWYSGATQAGGRGSIMVYTSTREGTSGWYAGLERRCEWRVVKHVGIDRREWEALFRDRAAGAGPG